MPKPTKTQAKKAKTNPTKPVTSKSIKTPPKRLEIEIPDMKNWLENATIFARKNPGALLVGGMAVVLAILLLLP